jgi:hypothetical protein
MDFQIKTDLSVLPKVIEFNHEELKNFLIEKTSKYNSLVVTEDSIKSAKEDKAKLNKFRTAIEDERKRIKKQCLQPYEEFEKKCKEIVALIDKPIISIDTQIKAFDDEEKERKYKALQQHFDDNAKELLGIITLDQIINPKWANKGERLLDLAQQIYDKLDKIRQDLKVIGDLKSPYEFQMKDIYLKTFDVSKALAEQSRLEEQDRKLAEIKKKQGAESIQQQPQVEKEPARAPAEPVTSDKTESNEITPVKTERVVSGIFKVTAEPSKIKALAAFMRENQIKFEVVKENN